VKRAATIEKAIMRPAQDRPSLAAARSAARSKLKAIVAHLCNAVGTIGVLVRELRELALDNSEDVDTGRAAKQHKSRNDDPRARN